MSKEARLSPGQCDWCGPVDWVSPWEPKGCSFHPLSGHMPGGLGPQLGEYQRQPINASITHRCFSPSLSPVLPLCLKINKYLQKRSIFEYFKYLAPFSKCWKHRCNMTENCLFATFTKTLNFISKN